MDAAALGVADSAVGTSLYVHVPFCAAKCTYCDFYSFAARPADARGFVHSLLNEADRNGPTEPRTVFVGGGTPSWLAESDLRALFDGLDRRTGFRDSAEEVTVECNPESLTPAKAELLLQLGATRLSIGVQSLQPDVLEAFGRVHAPVQAWTAFRAARSAGFVDVNVDLIYGAPGQSIEAWTRDLERILRWEPTHVSAYQLTFEPGTAFETRRRAGQIQPVSEEVELAFFELAHRALPEAGLAAYEVSNFARPGRECRHNLLYWENADYVGLGPSAVSGVRGLRAGNARSLESWRRAVEQASGPEWSERLSPRARLGETWWLGLRTMRGVSPERARRTAGFPDDLPDPCLATARELASRNLLELRDGRYSLTATGLPLADAVAAELLQPESEEALRP